MQPAGVKPPPQRAPLVWMGACLSETCVSFWSGASLAGARTRNDRPSGVLRGCCRRRQPRHRPHGLSTWKGHPRSAAEGERRGEEAESGLTTAYNDAAGRTPAATATKHLGGQTLAPGVYKAAKSLGLTGTVTLDAHGNANAVFVSQAGSTLLTASSSTVELSGGAQACNVFYRLANRSRW